MGHKSRVFTSEQLSTLKILDTTERVIKTADLVECYCKFCGVTGKPEMGVILKKDGWQCKKCGSKAQAAKIKGTKLSESTKDKLKSKSKESALKRRETLINRYGTDDIFKISGKNPMDCQETKDKIKQTNITKYGVEHPMKTSEVVKKIKQGNLKKYGVECTLHNQTIRKLIKENWIKKYGTDNPFNTEEVKEKIYATKIRNGTDKESYEEIEVFNFIKELGFIPQKSTLNDGNGYVACLDILIKEKNIAIEYNGEFWHSEKMGKSRNYHLLKTNGCKKKGYSLIHIWAREWVEKKDQVKSYLRSRLGVNHEKVMARKCEIRYVEKSTAYEFLDKNHLQGRCGIKTAVGLYHKDELVCLATLSEHHRNKNGGTLVLSRFCSKSGVSVAGGLGKLSKKLLEEAGDRKLVTWVDLRLSNEGSYVAAGWEIEQQLAPDYFYYDMSKNIVIPKQARKKNIVNTPEGMTESEHAKLDKLTRVWDCGKIRLTLKKP